MLAAVKALAATAVDWMQQPQTIAAMRAEFREDERREGFPSVLQSPPR